MSWSGRRITEGRKAMLRNCGYLVLVVFGAAAAWAAVVIPVGAVALQFATAGALKTALVVSAAAGLFAFYFAGYVYVRLTRTRWPFSGSMVGLLLGVVLFVLISLATPSPDPEAQADLGAWLSILALPICLSIVGGWVAGRRLRARPVESADAADNSGDEAKADSSLRSE